MAGRELFDREVVAADADRWDTLISIQFTPDSTPRTQARLFFSAAAQHRWSKLHQAWLDGHVRMCPRHKENRMHPMAQAVTL